MFGILVVLVARSIDDLTQHTGYVYFLRRSGLHISLFLCDLVLPGLSPVILV